MPASSSRWFVQTLRAAKAPTPALSMFMVLPAPGQDFYRTSFAITCHEAVRDLSSCSVLRLHQRHRPIVEQSVSATPVLGAATCATARQETRHNHLPAIASTSLWLPYPASPPTSPARQARLAQKDLAGSATSVQASVLADGLAVLHQHAMRSPDFLRIPQRRVRLPPVFGFD